MGLVRLDGRHRWIWGLAVLLALLTAGVVLPRLGATSVTPTPLWTERPDLSAAQTPPASPWVQLARDLKPAVVNVSTKRVEKLGVPQFSGPLGENDPFSQFFHQFLKNAPPQTVRSLGSGFIVNPSGYVVTNNHVVDHATEITVRLSSGRELPAKVLGKDPKTDIALLKIDATGLPVVPLGDSSDLQVGEPVMAIGNPFGLEETVTTGIVSATGRVIGEGPYDNFIQTDASINPGNSGGPLINTRGQAVGINTAIFSRSGGSVGIGFAIPINMAKPVVTQLAQTGHVVRGWLGVTIQRITPDLAKSLGRPDTNGALVSAVTDGAPAMKAGVKAGDVITEYDGKKITAVDELPRAVADTPVGQEVKIGVVRDGKPVTLTAKVAQMAEQPQETAVAKTSTSGLGLSVQSLTPEMASQLNIPDQRGVLVREVDDSGRAAKAGLQPGDVIVEVDRHPVSQVEDLKRAIQSHKEKAPLLFLVHRNGGSLYIAVG